MEAKTTKKTRRKYDATFREEVLKMVLNGRPVKEISQSLGVGENLIYRWKGRHKAGERQGEKGVNLTDFEALNKRIRELEMERDIRLRRKPWPFSAVRCNRVVPVYPDAARVLSHTGIVQDFQGESQCLLRLA